MGLFSELMSALFPPPKQYGTLSVTIQGEQVKSHGEQKIADFFSRNGIRYEYERPIEVGIWIFNEELCKPDFLLTGLRRIHRVLGHDQCRGRLQTARIQAEDGLEDEPV
jgi:hypothetical protein